MDGWSVGACVGAGGNLVLERRAAGPAAVPSAHSAVRAARCVDCCLYRRSEHMSALTAPPARARVAMALSTLSGDVQGIILDQLRNKLEPRLVMYFSSANKELRALLTPAVQQQLRTDYEEATALCLKVGMRDCKELREATGVLWAHKAFSGADLATLATLGSVLPAVERPFGLPCRRSSAALCELADPSQIGLSDRSRFRVRVMTIARPPRQGNAGRVHCGWRWD